MPVVVSAALNPTRIMIAEGIAKAVYASEAGLVIAEFVWLLQPEQTVASARIIGIR
jgi:hypothetical protein